MEDSTEETNKRARAARILGSVEMLMWWSSVRNEVYIHVLSNPSPNSYPLYYIPNFHIYHKRCTNTLPQSLSQTRAHFLSILHRIPAHDQAPIVWNEGYEAPTPEQQKWRKEHSELKKNIQARSTRPKYGETEEKLERLEKREKRRLEEEARGAKRRSGGESGGGLGGDGAGDSEEEEDSGSGSDSEGLYGMPEKSAAGASKTGAKRK